MAKPTQNLSDWADNHSHSIWKKIEFCRQTAKFNLHENSVTQELIYSFWQLAGTQTYPVRIYQSTNEKANGNDIEIAIATTKGFLLLPCQAKIINNKDRYQTLNHKVRGKKQIDLLLDYGKRVGGIPLYFFYNFSNDAISNTLIETTRKFNIERLGCSFTTAATVIHRFYNRTSNRWSIPNFYRVNAELALPFSELFKLVGSMSTVSLHLGDFLPRAKFYSERDLTDETFWEDLAPPAEELSRKLPPLHADERRPEEREERPRNPERLINDELNPEEPAFIPGFRILLGT